MAAIGMHGVAREGRPTVVSSLPIPAGAGTAVAGELNFTLTFTASTPMDEIQDRVIELVLGFTNGNRKLAGQLLGINPRTIRRRLGRKSEISRAA